MAKKERIKSWFIIFKNRLKIAGITGTSVQVAYYTLLALVPLLIALGNLLPLLNIDPARVAPYLDAILPEVVRPVLDPIIQGILTSSSGGLFIVTLAIFVWSASKAVSYLQAGFDKAYGLTTPRGAIPQRVLSMAVSLLILLILCVFVLLFTFGSFLLDQLPLSPGLEGFLRLMHRVKWPAMLLLAFCMLTLIYLFTPGVRVRAREALVGAAVATAGIIVLSELFSFYVRRVSPLLSNYGVLSSFLVLMFWLNFSAILINLGAVVNASIKEYKTGDASSGRRAFHDLIEEKLDTDKIADKLRKKNHKE